MPSVKFAFREHQENDRIRLSSTGRGLGSAGLLDLLGPATGVMAVEMAGLKVVGWEAVPEAAAVGCGRGPPVWSFIVTMETGAWWR